MLRRGHVICLLFASLAAAGAPLYGSPHYTMEVTVDYASGSFSGEMMLEYRNATGLDQAELFFRLYPNGDATYGDASVHVREASVDGVPVETETFVNDTVLLVMLPDPLPPDARATVAMRFDGSADDWRTTAPSSQAYGLLTRSDHAMTLTAFYPILAAYTEDGWALDPVFGFGDALMTQASTYDVRLTTSAGLTAVATGMRTEQLTGDGSVTHRFLVEGARDFSVALVDGHVSREAIVDGVALRTWFRPEKEAAGDRTLHLASDALRVYERLIGPIPYEEVELVEVPMQGAAGVEFSGLILVSSAYAARPNDLFYDIIISHEMAHQWFYAGVGNDVIEHPWLDESFATYLSYLFLDVASGAGSASSVLEQWTRTYEQAAGRAPHATVASPVYAFSESSTYSAFIYSGGAILLDTIRREIGDEAFFTAVGAYYADHLGRIASPDDLIAAFEASCGCRLTEVLAAFGFPP